LWGWLGLLPRSLPEAHRQSRRAGEPLPLAR